MEIIQRQLNNPDYDRNTLRFFLELSTTSFTNVTTKVMLKIAKTIASKKKSISGGLVPQKLKISRFINNEYVNIFEVHQASTKNTMINVDDIRIQSHPVPFKYVVSTKVYDIEKRTIVLQKQLDKMLTNRQRELFIANFDLAGANQKEIDSPLHYTMWLDNRLAQEMEAQSKILADAGGSTDIQAELFTRTTSAPLFGAGVAPPPQNIVPNTIGGPSTSSSVFSRFGGFFGGTAAPPSQNVIPNIVGLDTSSFGNNLGGVGGTGLTSLIMPATNIEIDVPNNNPFFEFYYLSNAGNRN